MFNFFKKPDSKKSVNQCLEVWDLLTERDRKSSAKNILILSRHINQSCRDATSAILTLGKIKQDVISDYGLRDHVHPAFMQVQIINDYIFSKNEGLPNLAYARSALEKMIISLEPSERFETISNLDKFI